MLTHARGREGTAKTIQRLLKLTEARLPLARVSALEEVVSLSAGA
jgi:hypothetical protein